MSRLVLLVTAIALTAAGCTLGPRYQRPVVPVPDTFRGATADAQAASTLADLEWQALFHDPALTELVATALKQNFDLRIAAERVQQARALYRISRSDRFPSIDAYRRRRDQRRLTRGRDADPRRRRS